MVWSCPCVHVLVMPTCACIPVVYCFHHNDLFHSLATELTTQEELHVFLSNADVADVGAVIIIRNIIILYNTQT